MLTTTVRNLGEALATAGSMAWQIGWALVLGFTLSAIVQAILRRDAISRLLGDARPATLARATGLGIASSSCSYAAVALARSLFRKGASFVAAIVFEIASFPGGHGPAPARGPLRRDAGRRSRTRP